MTTPAEHARQWRLANRARSLVIVALGRGKRDGLPVDALDVIWDALGPVPEACPVCGRRLRWASGKRTPASPSVDKIINTAGYVAGNVRWLCWGCNYLKRDCPEACLLRRLGLESQLATEGES